MLIQRKFIAALLIVLTAGLLSPGCKSKTPSGVQDHLLTLTLDWRPEPEFGGFYQAKVGGNFREQGIDIKLDPGGTGAPTWKMVASGQTDFGTTSADQVLIARSQGADVVALFAVYQTSPQGIMVHQSRGIKDIKDLLTSEGTLAAENNSWLPYLLAKYNLDKPRVDIVGPQPGIGFFEAAKNNSQQCFIYSEPILAEHKHLDPQTFLIADAGFNPYVTVLITSGKTLREKPEMVRKVVAACRAGWRAYLDDPTAANKEMEMLNSDMDAQTFTDEAGAQKRLIETEDTRKDGLGTMNAERWKTLGQQLVDLKVLDKAPKAEECFVNLK